MEMAVKTTMRVRPRTHGAHRQPPKCVPPSAEEVGFTNPVIGEIPLFPGTEMAGPAPARPSTPAAFSAAQVRAWAKDNGLDVPARGRLRPEIWDQYRVAHLA
jgi:Lsr2